MATLPFVRFNAPKETQKDHAETLEKANEAMWKASGARKAWLRATNDVAGIGRGWGTAYPVPKRWSGPEFKQKSDESEEEFLKRLRELKLENFPIVVSHVDPRNCWPTFDEMGEVDQVVELGEMTVRRIRRAYGLKMEDRGEREKVKIVRYADSKTSKTVIRLNDPVEAQEFEHGLRMNPYVLLEAPVLPENDDGYHWGGSVFDLRHLIPELDGAVSDLRHQTRRQTHSQSVLNLDLEERRRDKPDAASNADLIEDEPDKALILDLKESYGDRYPQGLTSPDVLNFLNFGMGLTKENAIRPVLLGILEQGGDSGVRYNTGAQIAQGSFGPAIENLKLAAEGVTRRMLASVKALSKEFPDMPDKVPVIYTDGKGGSKLIEIGPNDVRGWGGPGTIQSRIDLAIPINENAEIVTGRLAADPQHGIMSLETSMERYGHIENPREEMKRRRNERIAMALEQDVLLAVQQQGTRLLSQPTSSPDALQQRFNALSPSVQQAIQMAQQAQGGGVPEARTEAGRAQEGMAQAPSNTVATMQRGMRNE
jgi:hypothetical protein